MRRVWKSHSEKCFKLKIHQTHIFWIYCCCCVRMWMGKKKLKITKIYIFMENWIKSQHEERTGVKLSSFLRTKISFIEKLFGLSSQLSVSLFHWLFLLICAVEICVYVYLSIYLYERKLWGKETDDFNKY